MLRKAAISSLTCLLFPSSKLFCSFPSPSFFHSQSRKIKFKFFLFFIFIPSYKEEGGGIICISQLNSFFAFGNCFFSKLFPFYPLRT
ncbi:unnamed protein product [Meloidogyne enterolobii]|uniref:Uncharacterized protein n=1 Tax=Meloidogyne enterolobii TaxID=390850 RepID=A0ACB1AC47_MELEN